MFSKKSVNKNLKNYFKKKFFERRSFHFLKYEHMKEINEYEEKVPVYSKKLEIYGIDLPKNMGEIYQFTHDIEKLKEDPIQYNSDNVEQILTIKKEHQDHYMIIVTPTVFLYKSHINHIHDLINSNKKIGSDKFFRDTIMKNIIPGHITIIHADDVLSHSPTYYKLLEKKQTGDSDVNIAVKMHVELSAKEKQKIFNYVFMLHPNCFSLNFKEKIKEEALGKHNYDLFGEDEKTNCALISQKVMLQSKDRSDMNPLSTSNLLLRRACINFLGKDNKQAIKEFDRTMSELGIGSDLREVCTIESLYKLGQVHFQEDKGNDKTPKMG